MHPLIVVSRADKGGVVRAKDVDWLQNVVSLEELLLGCGVAQSKTSDLDEAHSTAFRSRTKTKVMLGVIP